MDATYEPPLDQPVVWSRGEGCRKLAELLAPKSAVRAEDDLRAACLEAKAELVVMRKLGSFDLVSTAVPSGFDPDRIERVVAAVGGGPHSDLAATIAMRVGTALGVPAEAVSAYRNQDDLGTALDAVASTAASRGMPGRVIEVQSAADLISMLDQATLLVLGAPGGWWLQRQFLSPGARLTSRAPGGSIVVRSSPKKAFQVMEAPNAIGMHMRASDARALVTAPVMPVVDGGRLVGVVRREALDAAAVDAESGSVMELAPVVSAFDLVSEIGDVIAFFDGSPVPLVDRSGMLVGLLHQEAIADPQPG